MLHVSAEESPPDGFWQPITGGIKEGETAVDAVVREVCEETSITVDPQTIDLVTDGLLVPIDETMQVVKSVFVTRVDQRDVVTNPREHDDHRWTEKGEVEAALTWQSNRHTWSLVRPLMT